MQLCVITFKGLPKIMQVSPLNHVAKSLGLDRQVSKQRTVEK
jgi:hypothetical protein